MNSKRRRRQLVRRSVFSWTILVVLALAFLTLGCAPLLEGLESAVSAPSDRSTPADALREALRVGTARTVEALGASGGYLDHPQLRIGVPHKVEKIAKALRAIGLGKLVDDFETSMNRAAEQAAPLAKPVFMDAISEMSFEDALTILRGSSHEATDYFRAKTSARLTDLFQPKVSEQLASVGATRRFDELMDRASKLPLIKRPPLDLASYVTEEALDGLFDRLGREEVRIREDPVARSTAILKRWFGG